MSTRRLVITAVLVGTSQSEVARTYGVSQGWISKLMTRYRAEGEAAFEPRSRRPRTCPSATPPETIELVVKIRRQLTDQGLDAGADTIGWHLTRHHHLTLSRATINRALVAAGTITPDPSKRPKSSYIRFEAEQPNETWQSDFTHYRLTPPDTPPDTSPGPDVEIITWLDDHSRYLLHVSAHPRITGPIVVDTFTTTVAQHGFPASTLTDNGMVYTTRFSAGARGRDSRNGFETLLRTHHVVQKNSRPNHPTTCGKVERVQQTLKKWLRAQPHQPATITDLQTLLDTFVQQYNHHRPHRSLPHHATPATAYTTRPKASPATTGTNRATDTHDRVRHDRIDTSGLVTLRVNGRLHHIGVGRTHARTPVLLLVHDLHVRVIHAATAELLRELTIDPTKDYQPTGRTRHQAPTTQQARTLN